MVITWRGSELGEIHSSSGNVKEITLDHSAKCGKQNDVVPE